MEVSTSGYYDWLARPECHLSRENRRLTERNRHYHQQSQEIYGSPKIHRDLVADGETCSVKRVARLMQKADIKSKMAWKFVITTNSRNTMQPAPDLLQRRFIVDRADEAWVSDTTFIATREG
jgi:putative transposase